MKKYYLFNKSQQYVDIKRNGEEIKTLKEGERPYVLWDDSLSKRENLRFLKKAKNIFKKLGYKKIPLETKRINCYGCNHYWLLKSIFKNETKKICQKYFDGSLLK